jgi:hypothetical protein
MNADPIIAEVWQIKDDLAREAGYDIHQLCENTRKWMAEHPHPGPVVHDTEDLRRLREEAERKADGPASIALREQSRVNPSKPISDT